MKKATKNLFRRFLKAYISANSHVFADVAAVLYTYQGEPFALDLALYQIRRKLSADGFKSAAFAFVLNDPYMKQKFGLHKIF
jgi:hypothetical protein